MTDTTARDLVRTSAFILAGGQGERLYPLTESRPMLALHRIGGYIFIALFCVMAYFMIARIRNGGGDASPTVTLHLALAITLSPLLFIKVLIARYYKSQHGLLIPGFPLKS